MPRTQAPHLLKAIVNTDSQSNPHHHRQTERKAGANTSIPVTSRREIAACLHRRQQIASWYRTCNQESSASSKETSASTTRLSIPFSKQVKSLAEDEPTAAHETLPAHPNSSISLQLRLRHVYDPHSQMHPPATQSPCHVNTLQLPTENTEPATTHHISSATITTTTTIITFKQSVREQSTQLE
jgi:hypothetical protein